MSSTLVAEESPGSSPAETDPVARVPRHRIITASLVGTTIEFYDFYVYATAAVAVFPALFFTGADDTTRLLASMATFAAAFFGRPIGSVVFGHFGDRIGRKATLVGALLTMGLATFLIGLLPTYHQIAFWAPAMLTILRFAQGLGLGGEWSGAALLASEYAEPGKRARAAMWPQLGAPFGFILANGFVLGLTTWFGFNSARDGADLSHPFMVWGWRVPFLFSVVMVLVGLYVRVRLEETPVFRRAAQRGEKVKAPVAEVFRVAWRPMILGTFIMLSCYVLFYLMTAWILSFGIGKPAQGGLGIGYHTFLKIQLAAIVFFAVFVPVSGWLADRMGRRRQQLITNVLMAAFGLSFGLFMAPERIGTGEAANIGGIVLFLSVGMVLMGLSFGSMSAYLPELFPTNVRYTGSGISYNVASILGAAITPYVAVWLNAHGGVAAVGWYLSAAAVVTIAALLLSHETRDLDLDSVGAAPAARRERPELAEEPAGLV
ncbi:MHS family MFS transporter [Rothia kristinae]|uniref:MHS family MFS transporter n=1 Tax=Rothia kristinae TaxID=37923 RepID=A0A7T4T4Y8_9MICC|nr:MFS transporter [Rothia kristinae]MDN5639602.1 MHS family MFS transporter [Actinomycetes bacterium]QQC59989.1 MHS family MFS transporter [Rothia kristinae]